MKRRIVFQSARIFDGASETLRAREQVFVEGGVITRDILTAARQRGRGRRLRRPGTDARFDRCACSRLWSGVEHRQGRAIAHVLPGALCGAVSSGRASIVASPHCATLGGPTLAWLWPSRMVCWGPSRDRFMAAALFRRPAVMGLSSRRPRVRDGQFLRLFISRRPTGGDCRWSGRGAQGGA